MAPKYKLTYFDFTGLGESIRFLFSYGGIEFIDNRVSRADWVALKPSKYFPITSGKPPKTDKNISLLHMNQTQTSSLFANASYITRAG